MAELMEDERQYLAEQEEKRMEKLKKRKAEDDWLIENTIKRTIVEFRILMKEDVNTNMTVEEAWYAIRQMLLGKSLIRSSSSCDSTTASE